jgi:hypothetical protein
MPSSLLPGLEARGSRRTWRGRLRLAVLAPQLEATMAADAFALVRFAVVRPLVESGTVTSKPDRQLRLASAGRRRRGGQAVAPVRGLSAGPANSSVPRSRRWRCRQACSPAATSSSRRTAPSTSRRVSGRLCRRRSGSRSTSPLETADEVADIAGCQFFPAEVIAATDGERQVPSCGITPPRPLSRRPWHMPPTRTGRRRSVGSGIGCRRQGSRPARWTSRRWRGLLAAARPGPATR